MADPFDAAAAAILEAAHQGTAARLVEGFNRAGFGPVSLATTICAVAHLQAALLAQLDPAERWRTAGAYSRIVAAKLEDMLPTNEGFAGRRGEHERR